MGANLTRRAPDAEEPLEVKESPEFKESPEAEEPPEAAQRPEPAPSLITMPTELLLYIWRNLHTRRDRLALVETSRRFLYTFAPVLYRENIVNGQSSGLFWAAATGNIGTLELFANSVPELDVNAVRNPPPPHLHFEKMRQAARENKLQAWQELSNELRVDHPGAVLQAAQYYMNKNNGYCTALHLAVKHGHISAVQWLIDHGADVDGPGRHLCNCRQWFAERSMPPPQYTPLHTALCCEWEDIAILLLQHGASTRVSNHLDPFFPTLHPAVPVPNAPYEPQPVTALMTAAQNGLLSGPLMSLLTEGDRRFDILAGAMSRSTAFHFEATCLRDASLIRRAPSLPILLTPWLVSTIIVQALVPGNFVGAWEMFNNASPAVSVKLVTRINFGPGKLLSWVQVCCFTSEQSAGYFGMPWEWTTMQDSEEVVGPAKWIDIQERQEAARRAFLAAILDAGYSADTGCQPEDQKVVTTIPSPLWHAVDPELGPEYVKLLLNHGANVKKEAKAGMVFERAVGFWKENVGHGDDEEETVRLLLVAGISAEAEINAWLGIHACPECNSENAPDGPIKILDMILKHATISNVTATCSYNAYEQQALWCLLDGHHEPCTLFVQHQHVRFRFLTDEERCASGGRKSIKAYTATDEERRAEAEFNAVDHVLRFAPWAETKRVLRRSRQHAGEETIHPCDFGKHGFVLTSGYDSEDSGGYDQEEG